jgi:hypothetical protein
MQQHGQSNEWAVVVVHLGHAKLWSAAAVLSCLLWYNKTDIAEKERWKDFDL